MRQTIKAITQSVGNEWTKEAAIGITASVLLAICAPFSLHLPFTPVPVTLQVQVALFLSALLGPRKAVWMILAFLSQGIMGWPVFAGGASTVATLIGPRGGYLFGYLVAAYFVGKFYQARLNKNALQLFISMTMGNLVIYLCGFAWLAGFVGLKNAFFLGIAPFAFADLTKLVLFTLIKEPAIKVLNFLQKK